ncbi:MAG: hypothetical protein ACK4UJ_06760 [Leptonema sp. (in: bacteria)]
MKFKYLLFFIFLYFFAILFLSCKKDPDTTTEKIILYNLFCAQGINACYDSCAESTGFSDSTITGTEYNNFKSCTSSCDFYCNLSFLLIPKD